MTVELGHFALVLAFALSLVQATLPLAGARRGEAALMRVGDTAAFANFLLVAFSFAMLTRAYLVSDFSVANVWENSHTLKPLLFKISGVWGNHEGSMMLWVLILVFYGACVAAFGSNLAPQLRANVQAVQGMVLAAFLAFILFTSNPFLRLTPAPFEGKDLNPVLQDVGLAVHPPLLYLGYVGFSVTFAFAIAAMISGRIDAAWARWVRPWALAAWIFLTAGIAMGSWWAYYELGWGGWWFWDPVENASFIPWLSGTALLHSAVVMEKRDALKIWTVLLAILTFSMSLLGTFLVRSGVLTSVHAFASDPTRGVFILAILVAFIGGSLFLFALRAPLLKSGGMFKPISREGALVLNNLFLTTAAATVLVGTLYPLAIEALTGDKISVGAPFFNATFGPLMIPLLAAAPFGPLLSWKRADLAAAASRLYLVAAGGAVAALAVVALRTGASALAAAAIGLAVWLIVGAFAEIWMRSGFPGIAWRNGLARIAGLPRPVFGAAMAHAGLGVTLLGIVSVTAYEQEVIRRIAPGESVAIAGYELAYRGLRPAKGSNYVEEIAVFDISRNNRALGKMLPAKRVYTTRRMPTTEAAIRTAGFSQLYLSLGDAGDNGSITVRVWWKPLVALIWGGAVLMALGGAISLSDRRLRVGAPKPALDRSSGAQARA
jgi:cytochrome c-type biogenesis protein CcmF